MLKDQKGSVDLTGMAIAIVILGVVGFVGSSILLQLRDNALTDLGTTTLPVQTMAQPGADFIYFDSNLGWLEGVTFWNDSTGDPIGSGNYTLSIREVDGVGVLNASTITTDETGASGGTWSFNTSVYNSTDDSRFTLPNDASNGLLEFGDWFEILVIVGVAAVVLSLIFLAFRGKGGSGRGGAY